VSGALKNLRVLDITHVLAGPYCTYQLALLGADVTKIEPPHAPDCARERGPDDALNAQGLGLNYQVQGGNKRTLAVDLSTPEGAKILRDLALNADILVENYTTGALAVMGLGPCDLRALNPQLIYCSLTGYGDTGPLAQTGAYDNVIQAGSGIIDQSDGHKPAVSFVDYTAGLSAAFAILAAVNQRNMTGEGCTISVSMLEVAMNLMAPEAAAAQHATHTVRGKEAGITAYDTKQGKLMLGVFTPAQYRRLGSVLTNLQQPIPALSSINNWSDVWACAEQLNRDLAAVFAGRTCEEWITVLRANDLPCDRIKPLSEAVDSAQLRARGYFTGSPDDPSVTLPLSPFHMSQGGPALTKAPPRHGQDSEAVLAEAGRSATDIQHLRDIGVIR